MSDEQKGMYTVKSCPWLLLFVFFLQFVTGEMLNILWERCFGEAVPGLLLLACVQIFSVAVPCGIFILLKNVNPKEIIKHRKLYGITGIMCVIVGITAQPIAALLNSPVALHMSDMAPVADTPSTAGSFILTLIVIAVLPAFFEEILMRGIVFHATEKYGYRATLFISAIWFAILHNNLANIPGMLFLGFVSCYAVWMTQSVYAGILIHLSFNITGLVFQTTGFPQSNTAAVITLIISLFLFVPALSSLNRKLVRRYKTHGLFKQIFFAIFNFPMIIILLGFVMFHFTR